VLGRRILSAVVAAAILAPPGLTTAVQARQTGQAAPPNELDAFMAKVLERRNENWRALHDYILSERESFQILGPGDVPLHGQRREFQWFIRDGFLVRSPVRANGAALGAGERARYERDWLAKERERDSRAREKQAGRTPTPSPAVDAIAREVADGAERDFARSDKEMTSLVGGEPRFISEAYFMKFRFEPGNYYLAGRETLDGRSVIKVEYYPTRMFADAADGHRTEISASASGKVTVKPAEPGRVPPAPKKRDRGDDLEDEIQRAMNKVTLVTMWIDPAEYQIVRFTFDNVDFDFLPGRAFVRVDEARASMTMGRFFDDVWLPKEIVFRAGATLAAGSYRFAYTREFYDYRKGEVSARIRGYVPKEP
jgi:hypothetical protein